MHSVCDRCHQQMEKRSWEALHIYTDFYHNIIIRAHVRWQLTHSELLLLLKPESESIWILKGNQGASNLTKAVRVHS